jgi:hypothetical protein
MPGYSGEPVVTTLVCLFHFACEAAGATGTRHSLCPLLSRVVGTRLGRVAPRDGGRLSTSLRGAEATKQSRLTFAARWIASLRSQRRPGQAKREPGPIITNVCCCAWLEPQSRSLLTSVVMGPGVRRDDEMYATPRPSPSYVGDTAPPDAALTAARGPCRTVFRAAFLCCKRPCNARAAPVPAPACR